MSKNLRSLSIAAILLAVTTPALATAQAPTTAQFQQVLAAQLQKLKPTGFTVRTVLFEEVRAGRPNGGFYPFQVTASIHDYAPGYPANHYYGQTCVGRMEEWKFDMRKDDFGEWIVQGRMTITDGTCKDNPSASASAIPLSSVPGTPAGTSAAARPSVPSAKPGGVDLYMGEWACYGTGGRLMAGMGFILERGGKYRDTDGERGGNYTYDSSASTITFRGGFLTGQTGRNVRNSEFQLSSTVNCEPWR